MVETVSTPSRIWNYSIIPYWEFELTPLKDSIIVRCSEYDLSLFSYLLPILITFLINGIVLILILLVLSSPLCQHLVVLIILLAPFILHLIQIHAGYIDYQLVDREKFLREPQLLTVIVLPPMYPMTTSTLYMGSSKVDG